MIILIPQWMNPYDILDSKKYPLINFDYIFLFCVKRKKYIIGVEKGRMKTE